MNNNECLPDKKCIKNVILSGFFNGFSDNIIWVELTHHLSVSPLDYTINKDFCE